MSQKTGITRDDSETIGFVMTSLFCSAINLAELHEWCFLVIGANDIAEIPSYIFDLSEYEGVLAKIFKIIGFVPSWTHTDDDEAALCGIAMKRGIERYEWPFSQDYALTKLKDNSDMERRFRETFPFVDF